MGKFKLEDDIRELAFKYRDTRDEECLGKLYEVMCELCMRLARRYHGMRDVNELEELGHRTAWDVVSRLKDGKVSFDSAWTKYLMFQVRSFLPFRKDYKGAKIDEKVVDCEMEELKCAWGEDAIEVDDEVFDVSGDAMMLVEDLVGKCMGLLASHAPVKDYRARNLLLYVAVGAMTREVDLQRLFRGGRLGFFVSFSRSLFRDVVAVAYTD